MNIRVHIERVVLDAVPVDHPRILRRTLEKELSQRLREGGLSREFRGGGAVPHVNGGAVSIARQQSASSLGTQIAGAVYRGIGGAR